jgi:NAD(P)-dependent dehydrogenase (short-subunit alcohol dehydrogenase family)
LTLRLLPALERAAGARVVTVASGAHGMVKQLDLDQLARPRRYDSMGVYAASKACNILFSQELARRTEGRGIAANALHPGVVRSGFGGAEDVGGWVRWFFRLARPLMKTPQDGAATSVYLSSAPAGGTTTGGYFIRCRPAEPRAVASDRETARRLWALSARLTAPHLPEEAHDGSAG